MRNLERKMQDMLNDPVFKIHFYFGSLRFFLRRTPRGFVIGPELASLPSGAKDDHLTIKVVEEDEFFEVHRTRDNEKVWRHTNESWKSLARSYLDSDTERVSLLELKNKKTYFVSFPRLKVLFSAFLSVAQFLIRIFQRFLISYRIIESPKGSFEIYFRFEIERAKHLVFKIPRPFKPVLKFLSKIPKERRAADEKERKEKRDNYAKEESELDKRIEMKREIFRRVEALEIILTTSSNISA